jgi:hypothetical protein
MARQKMIATSKLAELIDLMKEKRVAKLTIPDGVEIVMFEPEASHPGFSIDESDNMGENKPMTDRELLLHSAG